jgi:hypothetical protein
MARATIPHARPHAARLHATLETLHRILEILGIVLLCTVYSSEVYGVTSAVHILESLHRTFEVIGILILAAVVSIHHK